MICNACQSTENLQRCSRCKQVYYCSREHQIKDWKRHKKTCKTSDDPVGSIKDKHPQSEAVDSLEKNQSNTIQVPKTNDNGDDFDSRPVRIQPFNKPPNDTELSVFVSDQLKTQGYCILDGYISLDVCKSILEEITALNKSGRMKPGQLAGGQTSGVPSEMVTNRSIRSDKIAWVQDEGYCPGISSYANCTLDSLVKGLNKHLGDLCYLDGHTKAMAACYPGEGTGYKRHIDNPTQDGRRLTCILYLNPDWDVEKDGGVLRLFGINDESYFDVAPLMNRLLIFWSNKSPHEVQPSFKTRYAVTVWYFDKLERQTAKAQQADKEIRCKVAEVEIQTKQMQKRLVEQKIENESKKAVNLLTPGEMEAIATLVGDRPEARDTLTNMGISPAIVDSLLQQLNTLKK